MGGSKDGDFRGLVVQEHSAPMDGMYPFETANDSEGNSRRNVYPRVRQHLGADEHEHDGEAFVEILKIRKDSGQ